MTFLFEIHGWQGFSTAGGPLLYVIVLGFVTFSFAPFQITKKLSELTEKLRSIVQ